MSATVDYHEPCALEPSVPIQRHRFNGVHVTCARGCRTKGYLTYSNLHKHYMDIHKICLHKVATLDPGDEEGFRRRVNDLLKTPAASRRSHRGHAPSHANRPSVARPPPQSALPSHPGGYQTPGDAIFLPAPSNLGQGNPFNSPSRYPTLIPSGSSYPHHIPGLTPPIPSEVGPSRFLAHHQTTRRQPYPQSYPEQQGPYPKHSPLHDRAKARDHEISSTATVHGLLTPETSPPWTRLEDITPTTRPLNEVFVQSPFRSSTGIPVSDQLTQASLADSTHDHQGSMPGYRTWHIKPQYQQLQTIPAGCHAPGMRLPTPPMGHNSLPDLSPRLPPEDKRKHNQTRRPRSLNPPVAPGPPLRWATLQPASHPYARPENCSTTSELAKQARENRQQESQAESNTSRNTSVHRASPPFVDPVPGLLDAQETETPVPLANRQPHLANPTTESTLQQILPISRHALPQAEELTSAVRPAMPPTPANVSHGQVELHEPPHFNVFQNMDELAMTRTGPPWPRRCDEQKSSGSPVTGLVGQPLATEEATTPVPTIQGRDPDGCHPRATNEEDVASRSEGDVQDPLLDILREGWRFIKAPDSFYLPETFNPFPHELEDLTDLW